MVNKCHTSSARFNVHNIIYYALGTIIYSWTAISYYFLRLLFRIFSVLCAIQNNSYYAFDWIRIESTCIQVQHAFIDLPFFAFY